MASTLTDIRADEERYFEEHGRKYQVLFGCQWSLLILGAVAGAVNAFAQSQAAQGAPVAADPMLLLAAGIACAIATLCAGPLTVAAAEQRKRRDFHAGMIRKIRGGFYPDPRDAANAINDYFERKA